MSSANDRRSGEEGKSSSNGFPSQVLRHRSSRPAITLPQNPSREELALDWTLSERDVHFVLAHRSKENLLRLAVQLCVLRRHGRFLLSYNRVSPAILGYLSQQLELEPVVRLSGRARGNTESDYQREIAAHLAWRSFDTEARQRLSRWIFEQVAQRLYVEDLVEKAEDLLRARRIILPGRTVFERVVNSAYYHAEKLVFRRMAARIPPETKQAIDRLLGAESDAGAPSEAPDFFRFAAYPPQAKAKHIRSYLARYEEIRQLQLEPITLAGVGPELLRRLSEAVQTYDVWQLRRFDDDKRYALAASFLYNAQKQLLDWLVEMHAQFMTEMQRTARNAWDKEHRRLRSRVRAGVASLRELAEAVLSLGEDPDTQVQTLLEHFDKKRIEEAVAVCSRFEHLQRHGLLEKLCGKYPNFRKYFRFFIELDFAGEPGSEPLLEAVELLRSLDRGEAKTLPADVDLSFVPEAWRAAMQSKQESRRRRTWEIALAVALKDALRRGDVYLPESRRHVSFWNLCYDEPTWQRLRSSAFEGLGLPTDASVAIEALVRQFHEMAAQAEKGLASNTYVRIEEGRLRTRREPRQVLPAGTLELRQLVRRELSRVRIEQLLMEVDARCGFSRHFVPPVSGSRGREEGMEMGPERYYSTLMAAIVAHGTNLGIWTMADSTEDITVSMLQQVSRTCLRQETIRRANAELVNFHRSLPESRYWGTGEVASSDGQRFGVRGSSLIATFYPRYFGYYDRVVSVYTHLSDLCSAFSTQVISCADREALYVLDGLLENDTELPVRTHITDAHGYTDAVCGLCYLLGFSFMPRLKNLPSQRLFKPAGSPAEGLFGERRYPKLDSVFSGTVNLDLIEEQWEGLVRVAASLKHRVVSANVIVRRLISSASSNRLAKALVQLGRLVKTIYLLRLTSDPEMRRQIRTQLSRGEARNALARAVFFADQGMFRSGDYYQMMNRASCLSLLSNAILVYNTLGIGRVLRQARERGQIFTPEAVSHVSPLAHRHVIVNGTYDFSTGKAREGRGQLFV